MALKNRSNETMIRLSAAWLDPKQEARREIERIAVLAALLPVIESAHADMVATHRVGGGSVAGALAGLTRQADELDQLHDRKARGIYHALTGMAELAEAPELRQSLLDLRDLLLPRGLATTLIGYVAAAGNAQATAQRVGEKEHAALKRVKTVEGRSLDDELHAMLDAGKRLGGLDAERAALERKDPGEVTKADAARARIRWIQAANALRANFRLATNVPEEAAAKIFNPLDEAEARAGRKSRKPEPPPPTDPPAK